MGLPNMKVTTLCFIFFTAAIDTSMTARILGVFPHFGKSHYIMFEPMMEALAERGHEIVVLTQFPMKNPPSNLRIIDLNGTIDVAYTNSIPIHMIPGQALNILAPVMLAYVGSYTCEKVLPSKQVEELLNSNEKFDLIFYESFNAECFLGFIHKYKAPSIAISSSSLMPWATSPFAIPDNPSYIGNHFFGFSDSMSFFERFWNTVIYMTTQVAFSLMADCKNTALARELFGDDMPSLSTLARNSSLLFLNTHFSLHQVRPYLPNVIEIAGAHIRPAEKLSKELQLFLDEAKEGIVYFSLGSTARGASLPGPLRDAFLKAFSELPMKVLWKWEEDDMPNKPPNVKLSKWLPQTAVLAHPNIKVFIAHGGLMGMLEAVDHGVPMICIPLFGDQYLNVAMAVKRGFAIKLTRSEITHTSVQEALQNILHNTSYQENAKQVSRAFHDRPLTPKETFIFWTEYVLRHKGAPHLQSAGVHLPLVQYLLLDVIAVLITVPLFIVVVSVFVARHLCRKQKEDIQKPKKKVS